MQSDLTKREFRIEIPSVLVFPKHNLNISKQCAILGLNRTESTTLQEGEGKGNLEMMQSIYIIQPRAYILSLGVRIQSRG